MEIETISREIIKPTSKTPNDIQTLQLSMVDNLMPPVYTVAFLFYNKDHLNLISQQHSSHKLKTSLSETLTIFHPFSGRINGVTVDSNDEGAVFVEARVGNYSLSGFLISSPDFESLQHLLPLEVEATPLTWPLLLVKATYFQCGGMALGICISHKLADATSLSTFIRVWSSMARGEKESLVRVSPEFAATKLYPPANEAFKVKVRDRAGKRTSLTKRFVFVSSKIEELRNKAAVPRPTRVQSVTSLIWRCVVEASPDKNTRENVLIQTANLRTKIPSLLSENLIGNLLFYIMILNGKGEVEIVEVVKELSKRAEELSSLVQNKEEEEEEGTSIGSKLIFHMMDKYSNFSEETHELHSVSSWCRLLLYDVNFGWGTPVWVVGNVVPTLENMTMLIDSKHGQGIEAWVTLHEQVMSLFEQNTELLAYASAEP